MKNIFLANLFLLLIKKIEILVEIPSYFLKNPNFQTLLVKYLNKNG